MAKQVGKTPWLVTFLEAFGGQSVNEATVEPSATMSRNQQAKILDGRWLTGWLASIGMSDGAAPVVRCVLDR